MDQPDSTTLSARFQAVPDPRHKRGRSYEWLYLLNLIAAAVAGGAKGMAAIADWIHLHALDLLAALHPAKGRIPSYATVRRVLIAIDIDRLEDVLAGFNQSLDADDGPLGQITGADGTVWRGQAVDGKTIRGASAHGTPVHLVGLVRHESGYVLDQVQVAHKTNEITAVPELLRGHRLVGTVTTMDALLTQHPLAQQIRAQGGHYLMVVKENQGGLWSAIDLLFREPATLAGETDLLALEQHSKGHGRCETRRLESRIALNSYLEWPDVGQVLRRTYDSVETRTGRVRHKVTYGISSLGRAQALPEHIAWLWRHHWTIENRVHYVRDDTMGEDRGQSHTGHAAEALAALRNAIIAAIRYHGWTNVAAALRHYDASPQQALQLIGAIAT
jgi:predicted transposase YbfD/YdcC